MQQWGARAVEVVEHIRHSVSALNDLRNVPACDPSERLAVLAWVFERLDLPRPSLCIDQTESLREHADALSPPPDGLRREYATLAAVIDSGITQALRQGAKVPELVAAGDFNGGLLFVQLPPSPFHFAMGMGRGHNVGVTGLGEERPVSVRGLAASLPQGHPLLKALPPSACLPTAQGPAFVLGAGVMASATEPKVPAWWFVRDVVELTVQAREHLRREAEQKASQEAWEASNRRNAAQLAKTREQLKTEEELAAVKQQLAALKAKGAV
jgi:hypothetical protein